MIGSLTIRIKVTLAYTLVFGVILSGFAYLVYRNSHDTSAARLDASLQMYAGRIEAETEEQSGEHVFPTPGEFRNLPRGDLTRSRYLLCGLDGRFILDDSLLSSAVPASGTAVDRTAGTFSTVDLRGDEYRVYSVPVEVGDTSAYFLTVAASTAEVESRLDNLRLLLLLAVPSVLVLAAIASYLITRAAFLPVSSMIATAGKISARNLGARLALPVARDEVRLLGETLNSMMNRIEQGFEAQRQFIADASHEIRTPLTIIRSDLEFLLKKPHGRAKSREITGIVSEVDRLSKMAENLLLLSRLEGAPEWLTREKMRIDEVIVDCVQIMTPLFLEKGVSLKVHIAEAVEIDGDMDGVERMILNLLENSLKFTRRGGRVRVSLGKEPGVALPVRVTVEDTGCGIAPGDLPHIFRRFFRSGHTKGAVDGSGLGLAIVDNLVRLHGGMISVESEPGKGTSISLRFPL